MQRTDRTLIAVAKAAFYRSQTVSGFIAAQPSNVDSEVRTLKKKHYVILANGNNTLAVYRQKPDGVLRRMKRPPAGLID